MSRPELIADRIYPYVAGKMQQSDLPESGSNFVDVRDGKRSLVIAVFAVLSHSRHRAGARYDRRRSRWPAIHHVEWTILRKRRLRGEHLWGGPIGRLVVAGADAQVLNRAFPELPNIPKGDPCPEYRKKLVASSNFLDGAKAARVLGIQYRSLDDTMRDTALSLRTRFNF